jgi:hypothetical protein
LHFAGAGQPLQGLNATGFVLLLLPLFIIIIVSSVGLKTIFYAHQMALQASFSAQNLSSWKP